MSENALILFHVSRIVFAISNIWLMYSCLTPKRTLWFQILAFVGTVVLHLSLRALLTPMGLDPFFIGYALAVLYLLPVALIFRETLHIKLFVVFMIVSLSQVNFLICLFLEQILFGHMVSGFVLTGQLLELLSIPLVIKYIIPHIKNILEMINQQNYIFTLFPFFSYILLAFYGVERNYLLSIFIPLVLSTVIILFAYYLIARSIDRTKRQQQLEKQLALQRNHYRNLNDSIAATRATRHDLRYHLVTISGLLRKQDAAMAQEYLTRLCNSYDDSSIPTVCRNQSADALICHYLMLAKQENIAFGTNLHIPDDLGIDDLDLCVVIGNCLQNAFEACSKLDGDQPRFIDMKATVTKGYLVIKIANSFNGLVEQYDDDFISSKRGTGSGIGLTSIKTVAAKYQGHSQISFDQKVFIVSVSLQLPAIAA